MNKKEILRQIILDLDMLNCALNIDVGSGYCDDELDKYIKLLDDEMQGELLDKNLSRKKIIKRLYEDDFFKCKTKNDIANVRLYRYEDLSEEFLKQLSCE